jgi:hypothetical protein
MNVIRHDHIGHHPDMMSARKSFKVAKNNRLAAIPI